MKDLAQQHRRHGSPRIHLLLKKEGLVINHKITERIYKEEGVSLRKPPRKKVPTRTWPNDGVKSDNAIWRDVAET